MHGPMCEYYVSRFDDELNCGRVTEFGPDDVRRVGKRRAQTGNRDFISLIEQKSSRHWYLPITSPDALDCRVPVKLGFHRRDGLSCGGRHAKTATDQRGEGML